MCYTYVSGLSIQAVGNFFLQVHHRSKLRASVETYSRLLTRCLRMLLGINAMVAFSMTLVVTVKTLNAGAGQLISRGAKVR